ncbi:peptidoglycan D,D-transpeptidase FtsI family protein [Candidatus Sulfurimonas baltica]|uniref:Penicillin-binding protein 2 n=1 Tax=Candidatus Sulfurimonas baltica TaxID=2740404 RepID=A0A7S7RMN7_9BACT|nr:penicillin-binding protein 2 [Candidatus Sulfurimonas baltica]QOY51674.1 penicillin-binding protein 2 [Candidatus Sulfurimonas baltica]
MINQNKSKKILLLYVLIALGFLIFLSVMLLTTLKSRDLPSLYTKESSKAVRGSIISADGFHIASTKKLYKAIVNTHYIDPLKKDLFVELFSIYSGIESEEITKKLSKKRGVVVLSYNIEQKQAQYLKRLAYELRRLKVFVERKSPTTGRTTLHGLSIIESGESREYSYGDLLTPIIGYPHKIEEEGYTYVKGVKGLERRFEDDLQAKQDELSQGPRDVNSYIILNKKSFSKPNINGLDIKLTIPISLQIRVERMLDNMKVELDAKHIMIGIMNSTNGEVIALASSNRFLPKSIKKSDYPSLNSGMIEYSFEPGSVIKTITFALLLDKGLINPYDLVNGHNGRFKIGKKIITDEHKFDWLSAENTIVHSSNIGIAQLAQKLSGAEFHEGLKTFGFSKKSTPDLIYEKTGSIPSAIKLNNEIYKATCSYGYGMKANLMQLLRAYSAFNNNGRMVTPKIVSSFIDSYERETKSVDEEQIQVIKSSTAHRVKKVLIKTVNEGTGTKAKTEGLVIGGKTGTSHIVENGKYVRKYNTAFIGFANDQKQKYTIGVAVVQPKKSQFAAQTSVPVFKKAVEIMVEEGYLRPLQPDIVK